ncbi:sensor histidine kinase [Segetibacter aerophilus]|uniref:Histidine kinase n=1 Tax=Segetibacter aerophilus TaxID=670293 RepID=A0A512BHZ0_9BACT|nr:sensor histidine kinase [Segetibacter aerophilus]GEO11573.1 histidine kinase [Segetibacter aerophilus]
MTDISKTYKNVSTLKLTSIVVLAVSVLFPLLFAYINDKMNTKVLSRELTLTPVRLAGITIIIYGVIQVINKVKFKGRLRWLHYLVEMPVIIYITFWWLLFTLQFIDGPIFCGCTYPTNTWHFRQYIALYMVGATFIYIFQSGLNFYKLAQEKAAEAEKLQREYAQVRLQALKNQVNPHFLFNSLSVLSSLVHVSAEISDKFIQQLSKAYRYILEQKDIDWVTLQSELDFLDAYFFLLQIRFEKKVMLVKEVKLDETEFTLPPLTLQLLVENVVKHNKMSTSEPLTIRIYNEENYLVVANNINKREQHETSTGIGLENIQKRYAFITDKKIEIINGNEEFIVRIPLIKNNSNEGYNYRR